MKAAIMQPYFFPYIGYFQLMSAVDEFVVYDNIEYTKKGWINRNRILVNGSDSYLTLPLKKDSDYLNINDRFLAPTWASEKKSLLNKIREAYKKAPEFETVYPLIQRCVLFEDDNLFEFIFNSLNLIKEYLDIPASLRISSTIKIDHTLKAACKVMAICKDLKAATYINPVGGIQLYSKENFKENGIDLLFLKTNEVTYHQFGNEFVPHLSIIDVLMFNSKETVQTYLKNDYSLT